MVRLLSITFLIIFSLFAVGCAVVPKEEGAAFVAAAQATKSGTDPLFDQLSAAEKHQQSISIKASRPHQFAVSDAYAFATNEDGSSTRSFRAGVSVIVDYAALLQSLQEGSGTAATQAQIQKIAADISAAAVVPELGAAALALKPLIDHLLNAQSRMEARRLAIDAAPKVEQLIIALRDAAPAIYKTIVTDKIISGSVKGTDFDEYKVVAANYVVLLDKLLASFRAVVSAYERPSNAAVLRAISENTGELTADAKALRSALGKAQN
ncbi:hypothetical protein HF265_15910 [Rhizobium leguminosarum]|uniref:hypothetical protein n=1 Tax=Rhizobium leguminosarum TaxID=384 RepID=UPI001C907CC6|nr:hypothetical protein [Rhizobium leguminosarum]MBY3030577.1 hypothetical protein [Rhizobium leguminosarum]